MAYEEGKDFKWVPMKDKDGKIVKDGKGNPVKTRKFFTKAEKNQMKAETKATPKAEAKSSAPKSTSTRPQARRTEGQIRSSSGGRTRYTPPSEDTGSSEKDTRDPKNYTSSGRGKGMYELGRRRTEQRDYEDGKRRQTTASRFPGLTRIADSFNRLRERLPKSAQADYSSNDEAMKLFNAFKKEWAKQTAKMDTLGADAKRDLNRIKSMFDWGLSGSPSTGSGGGRASATRSDDARARATRTNRSRNSPDIPGMAKGGMVKSGSKDYKKSGMFYKSASPRGYK